jgi:hypothetical protein
MRIAIVGNCQARPVGTYLKQMCPSAEVLPETIVHLSKLETSKDDLDRLDKADLVIAQLVQDGYPASHLTSNNLRQRYGSKLLTWPNLFFTGNCVGTVYITKNNGSRLTGPLAVYHNRFVYEAWQAGIPVSDASSTVRQYYLKETDSIRGSVQASLDEFERRDIDADIRIFDYLNSNWRRQKLFYTFNHPSSSLMIELTRRIAEAAKINVEIDIAEYFEPEPLNQYVPGVPAEADKVLDIEYRTVETSKGISTDKVINGALKEEKSFYGWDEIVKCFYTSYDRQCDDSKAVRYTPNY